VSLSTGVAYFRVDTVHHFHNTKELSGRDRIRWTCLADTTHYATRNSNNDIHTHKYTHTHSHTHTRTHTHAYKQLGNNREISISPPSACTCMCLCVCVCVCVCVCACVCACACTVRADSLRAHRCHLREEKRGSAAPLLSF